MTQMQTNFDLLLSGARDLDISVITGRLWPPKVGDMWIGDQSLDELLLPHATRDAVALAIIPGGPGWEHVRMGKGTLDAEEFERLSQLVRAAGGHIYQGRLARLTPKDWLEQHPQLQQAAVGQSTLDMAKAAGWPASFGNYPVLFLDDRSIYHLLAREDVGRNVTLLIGTIAHPAQAADSERPEPNTTS